MLIKDNRFKVVVAQFYFVSDLNENYTARNILCELLSDTSKAYPTKQAIRKKLDDLYGASLKAYTRIIGNKHVIIFQISGIKDKYTMDQEANVQNMITFLNEIIFNPADWTLKQLEEIKLRYKTRVLRENDDIGATSMRDALKLAGENTLLAFDPLGDINVSETLTLDDLKTTYKMMIENDIRRFYIVDDKELDEVKIENNSLTDSAFLISKNDLTIKKETKKSPQSFVNVIVNTNTKQAEKTFFIQEVANRILGGSDSLLFRNVREKLGLAYSVFSQLYHFDGIILIHAGVEKNKINDCVQAINHELTVLKNGDFTQEHLEKVKQNFILQLKRVNDSQYEKIANVAMNDFRMFDFSKQEEFIKKITKADIVELTKKWNVIYEYCIEGDENGEN